MTPDGKITDLRQIGSCLLATVQIEAIAPQFLGYEIDPTLISFNLKSTLAQLGLNGIQRELHLEPKKSRAHLKVELSGIGELGAALLKLLPIGAYIGKLFAADPEKQIRDPETLIELFGKLDSKGRPLLCLGPETGSFVLEKIDGRTVAFLSLLDGILTYQSDIYDSLPTLIKALCNNSPTRHFVHLHQKWQPGLTRRASPNELLLVRTAPLHIQMAYARVVHSLLPPGVHHTSADFLQPDTTASGDIYELYGASEERIDEIPLEFFTLES